MAADSRLTIVLQDAQGDRKQVPVFFASTVTPANIQTYATAFIPLLEATELAQCVDAFVQLEITLPAGLRGTPDAASDVQEGGQLAFTTDSRYKFGVYIPALDPQFFTANAVDITDPAMVALQNAYTNGLGGVTPTDGHGVDVGAISTGKRVYRK